MMMKMMMMIIFRGGGLKIPAKDPGPENHIANNTIVRIGHVKRLRNTRTDFRNTTSLM